MDEEGIADRCRDCRHKTVVGAWGVKGNRVLWETESKGNTGETGKRTDKTVTVLSP